MQEYERRELLKKHGHGPHLIVECSCGSSTAVPIRYARENPGYVHCSGSVDPRCNQSWHSELLFKMAGKDGFVDMTGTKPEKKFDGQQWQELIERMAP